MGEGATQACEPIPSAQQLICMLFHLPLQVSEAGLEAVARMGEVATQAFMPTPCANANLHAVSSASAGV
jgi:hypothetical protein